MLILLFTGVFIANKQKITMITKIKYWTKVEI